MIPKARRLWASEWSWALVSALALFALALLSLPAHAQGQIDPRFGHLVLTVRDLTLHAGPVTLELQRALDTRPNHQGLFGHRWTSNWESRAVSTPTAVVINDVPYAVAFTRASGTPEYQSISGERLVIHSDGRFVRTKLTGITETFDQQGRLIERDYRNGNKATVRYGANGRIARIDGPKGSFIQFSADNQGRVTRIETSTGASVRYAYVGDNLTEIQVNGGPVVRYGYDASGALTRIDHPWSGPVELAYDTYQRVVSRRWADGAEERFEYDDAAREQRRIDPAGAVTVIRFDEDGRRAEVIDPRGGKTVVTFDANGRAESVTDPSGRTAKTIYDALGRPAAFHDAYGQVTHYEYLGATGRVKTIARPDGTRESLAYDPQQNVTEIKLGPQSLATLAYHPDGTVSAAKALAVAPQRLTYDDRGRLQTLTNPLGERLQWSYDARGNPLRAVNPLGGVTTWQWNAQGQLVSETDPIGVTTRYEYDSSGRLARVIDPLGRVIRFEYDVRGRLVAETDPSGQQTRYEYDRAGRLVKLSEGGASEHFRYDAAGNLIGWVDRLGRTVQFEYDALDRVTQERWSTGLQVRYQYDERGQVTTIEDSAGRKLEWHHDGRGRVIAQRDALGAMTQFEYDALGNVTARRDPRGQSKQFAYTAEGALARVQEPSGDAAEYRYDAAHRLVEMVRPSGGKSRFAYNGLGHLTQDIDPLGHERRHQYDVGGRLVASTDAVGRTTRYSYDAAGRLTEKRFADGKRVTFKYDSVGNLLEADDGAFPVRYEYDTAGRRLKTEYPTLKKTIAYEYDAVGLRTKLIGPDGRVTRYEYDGRKQLAAIVSSDGKRIGLSYDAQQRLQSIAYANGLTGRWEYDAAGRVTKLGYVGAAGKAIAAWTYSYDLDGNLVRQQSAEGRSISYSYDAAGQLIEVAGSAGMVRYRYGRGGARAAMEAGPRTLSYRHDAADRLVEAGPEKLSYDANGNLVRREGLAGNTTYEYDTEDRLVKIQGADGTATTFGYAPGGERVWKRDADGLTYYIYDGLDLIEELDETGKLKVAYAHGPGIDQPLAMWRDGKTYYYHADRLGSISVVTDERGEAAAAYDYDAYGSMESTPGGVPNPFTFTGREWDANTRLYYYRARYYDPALGQFLSPDRRPAALDEPLEHNPYLYVRNQPLRFVDPLGLAPNNPYAGASTDELLQRKGIYDEKQWRIIRAQLRNVERTEFEEFGWGKPDFDKARAKRLDQMYDKVEAARRPIEAELKSRGYRPPPPKPAALSPAETEWLNNWTKNVLEPAARVEAAEAAAARAEAAAQAEAVASGRTRNPTLKTAVAGSAPRAGTAQVPRPVVPTPTGAAVVEAEVAAAAAAESGALAGLRGRLPSAGTVAKVGVGVALVPALEATVAALDAEPGQELEAVGNSLQRSGHGLLESGKKIAGCAAGGAIIGGCIGGPPGALIGAKIGAAAPIAVDTIKTVVSDIPKAVSDLKDELAKGAPIVPLPPEGLGGRGPRLEGPPPPTDRPANQLTGPVTGGLPGAPPSEPGSDPKAQSGTKPGATTINRPPPRDPTKPDAAGDDPTKGPRMPRGTPQDIAQAGQIGEQRSSGGRPPSGKGDKGGFGTGKAIDQEAYQGPPKQAEQDPSRFMCRDKRGNVVPCDWLYGPGSGRSPEGQDDSVRVPHDQLPPFTNPGKSDKPTGPSPGGGAGPCPPGCHPRPDGSGCHCPETAKSTPTGGASAPGGPGASDDLSGTWQAAYREPLSGTNFAFKMTLNRVAAGKWQGPLDYEFVGRKDLSFKTQATLQATGPGKVRLTYTDPRNGPQTADGTYSSSQIVFGAPPQQVTYTKR